MRERYKRREPREEPIPDWVPHTELGQEVFEGKITLAHIFNSGRKIKEAGIIDRLLPGLRSEIIMIGSSPGKGGGSRRTPTRRTARMHSSGRRYKTSALIAIGNENGFIGMGMSKAKDNKTAIVKATAAAKLNVIPVRRGCGSWECGCHEPHSIPFTVTGKSGSVTVKLVPAPKGIGLTISDEAKKLMRLAGIKDVWTRTYGETRSRVNFMLAIFDAFRKLNSTKTDFSELEDTGPEISVTEEEVEEEAELEKETEAEEIEIAKEEVKEPVKEEPVVEKKARKKKKSKEDEKEITKDEEILTDEE